MRGRGWGWLSNRGEEDVRGEPPRDYLSAQAHQGELPTEQVELLYLPCTTHSVSWNTKQYLIINSFPILCAYGTTIFLGCTHRIAPAVLLLIEGTRAWFVPSWEKCGEAGKGKVTYHRYAPVLSLIRLSVQYDFVLCTLRFSFDLNPVCIYYILVWYLLWSSLTLSFLRIPHKLE